MAREVRRDPITGEEVVITSDRVVERAPAPPDEIDPRVCPFCPGNEGHTRPTIQAIERDGRWVARAFANRRPALVVEESLRVAVEGPFERITGVGAHEVIVECPEHRPLHHLPPARTADALDLARRRLWDLRGDRRLRVLQWFRNHGPAAGASQPHPHAQVVGLPLVPARLAATAARARAHLDRTGRVLLHDVLEAEEREGRRIVLREGSITALCPFAPRDPFEVWLVPRHTRPSLADATDDEVSHLALAMHRALRALARCTGEAPTTTYALGAPEGDEGRGVGWHVRLAPRLVVPGGLEASTGTAMHGVFPEDAAAALRAALCHDAEPDERSGAPSP